MSVLLGSDVLFDKQLLRGRSVGLVCNPASVNAAFAHVIAWLRHRDPIGPAARAGFDVEYAVVLRRALARVAEPGS